MAVLTDPQPILDALHLPPATTAVRMPGFEATVWRVDLADGRTVAVRALRSGRASGRELEALRLAARRTTAAPRVVAHGTVAEQAVIVTSWCPGRTIGDLLAAGDDATALGTIFGRAQAQLHRPDDDDLQDAAPGANVLCHNDFQPFNVLAADGVVTGIVDWSLGALGDPRADLAWTRVVLALGPAVYPHLVPVVDDFVAGWRTGYSLLRPLPDVELPPFLAAAAERQAREWQDRADAGECPQAVADFADRVRVRFAE